MTACAVAVIAAMVTASASLSSLMALDTTLVMEGELWRLFTGHLAHLSWRQYLADAPAFSLVYAAYKRRTGSSSAMALLLIAAPSVSLAVMAAGIHEVYGGLSGLTCTAVSAVLWNMVQERPGEKLPYIMAAGFCCYLLFMGGFAGGVKVAHEAHISGAVAGFFFEMMRRVRESRCAAE